MKGLPGFLFLLTISMVLNAIANQWAFDVSRHGGAALDLLIAGALLVGSILCWNVHRNRALRNTSASTDPRRITTNPNRSATMKKSLAVTVVVLSGFALASSAAQAATPGQREALQSAKSYLSMGAFSRAGLIHQLESAYGERFAHADAVWGVDHAHANWNAEAVEAARSYLSMGGFSRASLIHQLESPYGERFTHAQAVYGVSVAYR